jgi:hypothetical protein
MNLSMMMLRRFLVYSMVVTLTVTSVACGSGVSNRESNPNATSNAAQQTSAQSQTRLADGEYPVQQATYDDAGGEYTLMLLNTQPGQPATYRTNNLQMARLTDEEIAKGQKSVLKVASGQPSLHLSEDFKIEYVHNVTENKTNPQTGQTETTVVRRESGFWSPFAGALAGQALGSLLFRPQYYFPPAYQPGGFMTGYGGYGRTYESAASNYQSRYNAPPAEVRNRQTFRSTGGLRTPTNSTNRNTGSDQGRDRSTGSGYGTNTLRRSNNNNGTTRSNRSGGFGSGRPSRSRGFGGRRR